MKIGCLYCSYHTPQYLHQSLRAWLSARAYGIDGHTFIISAVSVPFAEYRDQPIDRRTPAALQDMLVRGEIDYLKTEGAQTVAHLSEAEARTLALKPLLAAECDVIWLADGDELITLDNISAILDFVGRNEFVTWFKLALKNRVFTPDQYLVEPFTPPRIFRRLAGTYVLDHLRWDNDMVYKGTITRDFKLDQESLSNLTVPQATAWIEHMSWISDETSKAKVAYQTVHFARGAGCSFRWDDAKGLVWNEAYFAKTGQPIPKTARDSGLTS